jgi:uncharacterized coiled-coil DUF342 family protein
MDYSLIEFLVGIVTIIGFMYKFERDTREDLRREVSELRTDIGSLRAGLDGVKRDVEALKIGINELRREVGALRGVIAGVGEVMVEYLRLRGIISPGDADLLRITVRRLAFTATTNPLTEEERKRLLELVDKDDLTIEEAEELYRLARKLYEEYIDKTPDAFKALLYAVIKRTEAYMKYGKQASTSS